MRSGTPLATVFYGGRFGLTNRRAEQEATMNGRARADRVEVLERKVEALEERPPRVAALEAAVAKGFASMELQCSQLRKEMRAGDASLREEIRASRRPAAKTARRKPDSTVQPDASCARHGADGTLA